MGYIILNTQSLFFLVAFVGLLNQGEVLLREIAKLDRTHEAYLQDEEIRINRLVVQEKLRQFDKVSISPIFYIMVKIIKKNFVFKFNLEFTTLYVEKLRKNK